MSSAVVGVGDQHLLDKTEPLVYAPSMNIQEILQVLPHRYPFLLLDRMEEIVLGHSAVGIKNVTANEPCFMGHFPENPIMPGVLIIEALAQTSAALVMRTMNITHHDHLVYFMSITDARFRKAVRPGDRVRLQVHQRHNRGMVWRFFGQACVDGAVMAEATYTATIVKREEP
jgi:3-hydroxyacyl-[acyl-carrier-protein] dehydratase